MIPLAIASIAAAADLPTKRFVGFDGNLCGAGARALGVSIEAVASGRDAAVVCKGIVVVETGAGTNAVGGLVKSDSTGRAVAATAAATGAALPVEMIGYAMDASTGAGQFIRVLMC
jgi:hypothetical protein